MSESSRRVDPITIGRDGITVTKSVLFDEFPVPTVELVLQSERTDSALVQLREYVPDGYSLESIGFHAEYESEHWTAYQDNRLEFEREVAPGESVRTIYGLRITDEDEVRAFLNEPELVTVRAVEADEPAGEEPPEEVVDRERNDALRTMLEDEPDAPVEHADEAQRTETPPADTADAPATPTEQPDAASEAPATPDSSVQPVDDVAERLAEELRSGTASDEDRDTISQELGLDLSHSGQAQLDQLRGRMEDLFAYSEPVRAFIDNEGPDRLSDLEETVLELTESIDRLESRVADMEDRQSDELASLETQLADLDERLEDVADDVDDLVTWRGQLGEMFSGRDDQPSDQQ